jgi:hypothetical protein
MKLPKIVSCQFLLALGACEETPRSRADSTAAPPSPPIAVAQTKSKPMVIDTSMRSVIGVALRDGSRDSGWCLVTSRPDIAAGKRVRILWPLGASQETGRVGERRPGCLPSYDMGDVYIRELDIPALKDRTAYYDNGLVIDADVEGKIGWNSGLFIAHLDADGESELVQQCFGVRANYFYVTTGTKNAPARWSVSIPQEYHRTPTCEGRFGEPLTDTTTIVAEYVEPDPPGVMNVPTTEQADSLDPATTWFALRLHENQWELLETKVTYPGTGDVCGEETGGRGIKPVVEGEWSLLFARVPGLTAGPVKSGTISDTTNRNPMADSGKRGFADSVTVDFGGRRYKVRAENVGEIGFRIFVAPSGKPLTLYSTDFQDEGSWAVTWAGDMDRDGELDLVLAATRKYSVDAWQLHLSSYGKGAGRWLPAARAVEVGC